jgi:UDP-N-acetylmuramyl tripeptide synthase
MRRLAARLPDGVVVVTGTNGKTTTCRMLRAALSDAGTAVVANEAGSNMAQGVVTALVERTDLRGRPRASMGVFEVDEAALDSVVRELRPKLVVVLNLFRDQLDRYAELDLLAQRIASALSAVDADVLLDADDPRVAALAANARGTVSCYGFDGPVGGHEAIGTDAADRSPCRRCGARLEYRWLSYAQLGGYHCPACGLERPRPDVALVSAEPASGGGWQCRLRSGDDVVTAESGYAGVYNLYNLVAASAAAHRLGVPLGAAAQSAGSCAPAAGRGAVTTVGAGEVVLLLGKNPTGVAQVLQAHIRPAPAAPLLVVLNDAAADGRDVSWIYDAPFEVLAGRPGPVLVAGTRTEDMLTRLRYAEVDARGCRSLEDGLDELVARLGAGQRGFVLATYTAAQSVQGHLDRLAATATSEPAREPRTERAA